MKIILMLALFVVYMFGTEVEQGQHACILWNADLLAIK